jgi:hypothetical protein
MKNRLYLVCGGLLVAAAFGWAVWRGARPLPPEPVYEGKALSYWLDAPPDMMFGPFPGIAIQYLATSPSSIIADSNAVPFLIKALMRDNWSGAVFYRNWLWPKLPASLQKRLPRLRRNPFACEHAAAILASMGQMAKSAVPALVLTLKRSDDLFAREMAVLALWNLGPVDRRAEQALVKALEDKDDTVRQSVTNVLSHVRSPAAVAIFHMGAGKGDSNVVAAFVGALGVEDVHVRQAATNALLKFDLKAAAKAGVKGPPPP